MKKNRIIGLASGIALLLSGACSNDTIEPNKNQGGLLSPSEGSGGVYMTLDISMPGGNRGTRSETTEDGGSTGGTEIGSDAENFVSSALVVLASTEAKRRGNTEIEEFGFIVAGEVPGNRISTATSDGNPQYRAIARIQQENLNTLYEDLYKEIVTDEETNEEKTVYNVPEVYVFVFCNPTKELIDLFDGIKTPFGKATWINETCEVIQTVDATESKNVGIWGSNSFLMNNVSLAKRELPHQLLDWEYYSEPTKAFHLSEANTTPGVTYQVNNGTAERGPIKVERSVARFDFKDGSPLALADNKPENANRYHVLMNTKANGDFDNAKPIVDVQLTKMCLVNMSKEFYYVPRVSNDGLPTNTEQNGFEYCGIEKPWTRMGGEYFGGNYVVGPNAPVFGSTTPLMQDFSTYFNFPFFDDNGTFNSEYVSSTRWDVVKISDVLNGRDDNYEGVAPDTHDPGQYKVWRYVTENVIPVNQAMQVNGISTGVVFKGKLLGAELASTENPGYYEEDWNKGHIQNLAKCLNGETFTFDGTDHTLKGNAHDDPILYSYDGHLYMGWRHLRQAAIQASVTINTAGTMEINTSNNLYKVVFGDGPIPTYTVNDEVHHMVYINENGEEIEIDDPKWAAVGDESKPDHEAMLNAYLASANYAWSQWALNDKEIPDDSTADGGVTVPETLTRMREAVTGVGVTIYQSSKDGDEAGYYCYYYYWNRHNDNGNNSSMGPMEFDVVRNNVYKLSVNAINHLGHPRIPENDPDDPKPDDPDESDEIYIDVKVEIVPWVVRVNNIIF